MEYTGLSGWQIFKFLRSTPRPATWWRKTNVKHPIIPPDVTTWLRSYYDGHCADIHVFTYQCRWNNAKSSKL